MDKELDEKPKPAKEGVTTPTFSIPIWHKPAWITAIVGLVSVFLTVPEIVGDYLTKQQDILIAKEKTEELRLGNLESKQDQEFKIVNTTLSKQGTERVFVLRYLAATLDDDAAKGWAQSEVVRLDDLAAQQEELDKARLDLAQKERILNEEIMKGAENTESLKADLEDLKRELDTKKSEVSQLRQKAGIIKKPTQQPLLLIRIKRNPDYNGDKNSVRLTIEDKIYSCSFEKDICERLMRIDKLPAKFDIISGENSDYKLFGSITVSYYKTPLYLAITGSSTLIKRNIEYICTPGTEQVTCTRFVKE